MASLKEIRARIVSVSSTKKITTAMKMVSAAKLRKSEGMTLQFLPYKNKLTDTLSQYLSAIDKETLNIQLAETREVKRLAIVCVSSNTGLCGVFNTNVNKLLNQTLEEYQHLNKEDILIYPIGKKITDFVAKINLKAQDAPNELSDKPNYEQASEFIKNLVDDFLAKKIDKIVLLYNGYKNAATQIPTVETFLPLSTEGVNQNESDNKHNLMYFAEPDTNTFLNNLVPIVVRMRFYAMLLNSLTSEHGARMTAMQIASDNATEMINTIKQQYNRARQEVITNELLDIVSGSEALRNN